MHPNVFLRTFWRTELKPQVFVAMSFAEAYRSRFEKVIAPAIEDVKVDGIALKPYRVDLSKTGDSILSDIVDGIAHSRLVLADVSTVGADSKTGEHYRNGNVMYELGIALACRDSADVLLVRDDKDKFLFDVSTIPHSHIDFSDGNARAVLAEHLRARVAEQNFLRHARVQKALSTLTEESTKLLVEFADLPEGHAVGWTGGGAVTNVAHEVALGRLVDQQLLRLHSIDDDGTHRYKSTVLGRVVANRMKKVLDGIASDKKKKDDKKNDDKK